MIAGHHNPGAAAERPARNRNPLAGVLRGDPLTAREADLLAELGRAQSVTAAARTVGVTRPHAMVLLRKAKYKLGVKTTIEAVFLASKL